MTLAVAEYRKARSVELALQGVPYDDIAREVGYSNRGTAWRTVTKALRERVDEAVEEYRQTELARLDALQLGLWDKATSGDIPSANAVLKIMEKRMRLLGLDRIEHESAGPRTVVLTPEDLAAWGG